MNISLIDLDDIRCTLWTQGHGKVISNSQKPQEHIPLLGVLSSVTFHRSFELEQFGLFSLHVQVHVGKPEKKATEQNGSETLRASPPPVERGVSMMMSQASFAIPRAAQNLPSVLNC